MGAGQGALGGCDRLVLPGGVVLECQVETWHDGMCRYGTKDDKGRGTMKQTAEHSAGFVRVAELYGARGDGLVLYTQTTSVANSGMSAWIKVYAVIGGDIMPINVPEVGMKYDPDKGYHFHGGGLDRGNELVKAISQVVTGDQYAIRQRWMP